MAKNRHREKKELVEEFGILFESMGFPRMAGRMWAWLLTCDPPHQSAAQIAEAISVSRGSVSTMTRLLMEMGLIERVGIPGERSKFYRIRPGGFADILRNKMRLTTELRKMAERGLELLKHEPPEVRRRLEEYRQLCLFLEKEFPGLIEKWERGKR